MVGRSLPAGEALSLEHVQEAVAATRARPYDFGAAIRAVRLLADHGYRAEAHSAAQAYSDRHDGGIRGGDAIFAAVLNAPRRRFMAGEALTREGTDEDCVLIILAGDARVRRLGVGQLAELAPGTMVGEIASVTGSCRTASVYARGVVDTLVFEASELAELTRSVPAIYARLRETGRARMVAQLMGESSIFGGIGNMARMMLFEQCLPVSMPEGTRIISQGEPGRAVCIIASGLAEVWTQMGTTRHEVAQLGPGDIFGEMSVLLDRNAAANVQALTHLTLFALGRDRFEEVLAQHPEARARVTRVAEIRLGLQGDIESAAPVSGKLVSSTER